jgi:hypothetical protein
MVHWLALYKIHSSLNIDRPPSQVVVSGKSSIYTLVVERNELLSLRYISHLLHFLKSHRKSL